MMRVSVTKPRRFNYLWDADITNPTTSSTSDAPPPASADIGHGVACFNGEAGANNWPLRGGKYTLFEGGIRAAAFVAGGFVPRGARGSRADGIVHVADWHAADLG